MRPGVYVHYKGGTYLLLMTATHHDSGKVEAIYMSKDHFASGAKRRALRPEDGEYAWTEGVTWPDGKMRARFAHASQLTMKDLTACFGTEHAKSMISV